MPTRHAVVWLDHREAKIFFFDREHSESLKLSTTLPHHQTHNKAGTITGNRAEPDAGYFEEVIEAMNPASEWLITGPASAKDELASYIREHRPQLASRIVGVESCDHPTDGQLVAHARKFFRAADRMLP